VTRRGAGPDEPRPSPIPRRWAFFAWTCLLLTLASGTLLRLQWTGAILLPFRPRHLLHAHSHVALLGWTFVGVFGLLLAPSRHARLRSAGAITEGAIGVLVALIFVTFLQEGYGPRSIPLSMIHILVSYGIIWVYLRERRGWARHPGMEAARPWIDLSLLWFVVSTIGPFMLAFGIWMGEVWTEAWVGFYLALVFNGWLTFVAVGLLVGVPRAGAPEGARPAEGERSLTRARRAMAVGVLPPLLPLFDPWVPVVGSGWIAWGGALLFGGGLSRVGLHLLREGERVGSGRHSTAQRLLRWSATGAMVLAGVLLVLGTFPPVAAAVAASRSLVVGFVHLQLLGLVSAALALLLFRCPSLLGSALLLGGGWGMIGVLLWVGGFEVLGLPVYAPIQWILTLGGALALAGAVALPWGRVRPGP
jgi:hypothetical protein